MLEPVVRQPYTQGFAGDNEMQRKRADKILQNETNTPPLNGAAANQGDGNGASPYRAPREARPRIAPNRAPRWQPKENLLQIAAATGKFETLGKAIAAAGLTATFSEAGPFTLFAPTDRAFGNMPDGDLRALLADKGKLRALVRYHLVASKVRAPRKQLPTSVTTIDGKVLELSELPEEGGYRVSGARIVKTNIRASNGVIHAIDTVLTPR
jgi:uncharacterized surface protein with fasciclin (FAS1) repeats